VLVDGQPKVTVAQQHKLTKPRVGAIVERVLAAAQGVPRDWERLGVWLPPDLAQQVCEIEVQARARIFKASAVASREGPGQQ